MAARKFYGVFDKHGKLVVEKNDEGDNVPIVFTNKKVVIASTMFKEGEYWDEVTIAPAF